MIYNLKIFKRILREIRNPTSPFILKIKSFFEKGKRKNNSKINFITAICDFELTGYTYNFSEYLVQLNDYLKKNNILKYELILLPPYKDTLDFNSKYYEEKLVARSGKDKNEINWRIYNIILPLIYCSSIYPENIKVFENREELKSEIFRNTFPEGYSYSKPLINDINDLYKNTFSLNGIGLKASSIGLEFIDKFINRKGIDPKKLISLNIRDQKFDPKRNSNKSELLKFAKYLKGRGYIPLIIPDTNEMWDEDNVFKDYLISKEISCSVSLRIALYEKSLVNIFVPNGISTLGYLNENANFIFFKAGFIEGSVVHTKDQWLVEGNFPFSGEKQILAYRNDNFEDLKEEFERFIKI